MRTTQQLSITLPNEMADVVKAKVRSKSACDAFPLPGSRFPGWRPGCGCRRRHPSSCRFFFHGGHPGAFQLMPFQMSVLG
jgi:hypothetical protein